MLKGRLKYLALPLFLIGVVLIVFLQFISGRSINKLIEGNTRLLNDLKVQTDLKKLESDIVVLESNIRGAVITHNPEYSINAEEQVQLIRDEISDVNKKIKDKTTLRLMQKLDNLIEGKINFTYLVLTTLRERGKEPAELLITTNRGQILRDSIVSVIFALDSVRRSEMA